MGAAYVAAYGLIFAWLWFNWRVPGLQVASVGIGANLLAVLLNGGQMPIWSAAFFSAGFTQADLANDPFHFLLRTDTVAEFVSSGGLWGDVIPLPIPIIRDVVSIGDLLLALGIFWAIVYSMTRAEAPSRGTLVLGQGNAGAPTASSFQAGLAVRRCLRHPGRTRRGSGRRRAVRGQSPYLLLVRNRNFSPAVGRPARLAARRPDPRHRAGRPGRHARHARWRWASSSPRRPCRASCWDRSPACSLTAGTAAAR